MYCKMHQLSDSCINHSYAGSIGCQSYDIQLFILMPPVYSDSQTLSCWCEFASSFSVLAIEISQTRSIISFPKF